MPLLILILTATTTHAFCGDTLIQEGETCSNCPTDVQCLEGETCTDGTCQKTIEQNNTQPILTAILIVIGAVFLLIIAYTLFKRKQYGFGDLK